MSNNLGLQQLSLTNKRTTQLEPSPKGQTESSESVRSKLRESLAASLSVVVQQRNKLLHAEKSSQDKSVSSPRQVHVDSQPESTSTGVDDSNSCMPERSLETFASNDYDFDQKHSDGQISSREIFSNENTDNSTKMWNYDRHEFQLKHVSIEDDVTFSSNFIIKDDLLLGNGLCWESELDMGNAEAKESHNSKRPKLVHEEVIGHQRDPVLQCPQTLAYKIEAELFKLFGGVNKKYKEKGRSLLFNLKDRNNPELKERVLSGEIAPERLCSMTAEELASKELSQWRIAKAEEFAHMVVLPDSEVDLRRLVKKTHKGEFQVEVERDDSVSVEVALGASLLSQIPSKPNETEAKILSKPNENEASKPNENDASEGASVPEKVDLGDQSFPSKLTIPSDGADYMQGLMVDEFKDAEFLPPIVSLDEFMESLDSEPPFESLPVDSGEAMPISGEKDSEDSSILKLDSLDFAPIDHVDTAPDKPDKIDVKYTRISSNLKPGDIRVELHTSPPGGASKGEHVWEGFLQLTFSAMVTVTVFFKSGEKTSTKDWPSFLEIKGRVRMDAFEKFLQELPQSRSRAIMVVHFCWKEGSPESERSNLSEVSDSYVADERVGFAEPAPGVELYLCPPHAKTIEMLSKHLPKDQMETLDATYDGLIGIVVWRKAPIISTISPKYSSHQKQNSKRQHYTLKRQQELPVKPALPPLPSGPPPPNPDPPSDEEPIDDVPPGFGPVKEEDDLPEFDFAKGAKPPVSHFQPPSPAQFRPPPPRPVDQMRALIHRYGQGKAGPVPAGWRPPHPDFGSIETQPWNDDDDIPEWRPPPPQHMVPMPPPQQAPQQCLRPLAPPLPMPLQPLQPPQVGPPRGPHNLQLPWQPAPWWVPPTALSSHGLQGVSGNRPMQQCNFSGPPIEGQFYGMPSGMQWKSDIPKSRGV